MLSLRFIIEFVSARQGARFEGVQMARIGALANVY
jgi:hypothetical protein